MVKTGEFSQQSPQASAVVVAAETVVDVALDHLADEVARAEILGTAVLERYAADCSGGYPAGSVDD